MKKLLKIIVVVCILFLMSSCFRISVKSSDGKTTYTQILDACNDHDFEAALLLAKRCNEARQNNAEIYTIFNNNFEENCNFLLVYEKEADYLFSLEEEWVNQRLLILMKQAHDDIKKIGRMGTDQGVLFAEGFLSHVMSLAINADKEDFVVGMIQTNFGDNDRNYYLYKNNVYKYIIDKNKESYYSDLKNHFDEITSQWDFSFYTIDAFISILDNVEYCINYSISKGNVKFAKDLLSELSIEKIDQDDPYYKEVAKKVIRNAKDSIAKAKKSKKKR